MKKCIKIIVFLILVSALLYYFPKSIDSITAIDEQSITNVKICLYEPRSEFKEDENGNIKPYSYVEHYEIELDNYNHYHYKEIMTILNDTHYISKLQNLLNLNQNINNDDFKYIGFISFLMGNDYKEIHLLGDHRVTVSSKYEKTKVYYMTNKKVLDQFASYLKEYGIKQES